MQETRITFGYVEKKAHTAPFDYVRNNEYTAYSVMQETTPYFVM
jgi:hypothetical protein